MKNDFLRLWHEHRYVLYLLATCFVLTIALVITALDGQPQAPLLFGAWAIFVAMTYLALTKVVREWDAEDDHH